MPDPGPGDVLFLSHRVPWPPDRGDRIRSWHILRHLAARGRVHALGFVEDEPVELATAAILDSAASCTLIRRRRSRIAAGLRGLVRGQPLSVAAFASEEMRRAVADTLAANDIGTIYVFSSQMAQFVPSDWSGRLVMDFVDVDSAKFAAYADGAHGPHRAGWRWLMRREARLLLAHDRKVAERADASLFVSPAEAGLFRRTSGITTGVQAIGNGIDTGFFDPAGIAPVACERPLLVFTGQMDYPPNVEAVSAFAARVLPVLRKRHPGATFAIVGRAPTAAVQALARRAGVLVTGAVDDVRPWLAAADVVVAPLLVARGVQNKVLEAMAMARPVLVTPDAAQGIHHAGSIRVASLAGMADAAAHLIAHPGDIGEQARARVMAHYGWEAQLAPLDTVMGWPHQSEQAD